MKNVINKCSILAILLLAACQKDSAVLNNPLDLSDLEKKSIIAKGFSPVNAIKIEEGYLVEGDIILTKEEMQKTALSIYLRIAEVEQYRTYNLVAVPKQIRVQLSNQLPSAYGASLDIAIARYNVENLQVTMLRVTTNPDITIVKGNGNYLASAGFPTADGKPFNEVKINSRAIGNNPNSGYLATIIAHEMGHCIGFRHTDYMDRSYSCGGQPTNEGASTVGAVHIFGTPTGPDAGSWMLSCIGSNQDRPFNGNDKSALGYIY